MEIGMFMLVPELVYYMLEGPLKKAMISASPLSGPRPFFMGIEYIQNIFNILRSHQIHTLTTFPSPNLKERREPLSVLCGQKQLTASSGDKDKCHICCML